MTQESKFLQALKDVFVGATIEGASGYINDPEANHIRQFKPDFVFWLQRGTDYHVVFVDPKGTKISDYQRKVDDYKRLFEEPSGQRKVFTVDNLRVQVSLALYTEDKSLVGQGYADYWADHPGMVFDRLG